MTLLAWFMHIPLQLLGKIIGESVSLSVSAVHERIKRLEENEVILSYNTDAEYSKFCRGVHAFIMIKEDKIFRKAPEFLTGFDCVKIRNAVRAVFPECTKGK